MLKSLLDMRRKQYLPWLIMVIGVIGTAYGTHLLIYHFNKGNGLNVLALALLILGIVCLAFTILLLVSIHLSQKKKKNSVEEPNKEDEPQVVEEQPKVEEEKPAPKIERKREETTYVPKEKRNYNSSSSYASTSYVKLVGYGPLLRIEGNRIIDMRSNTYYRIENNIVNQDGYGIRYEINGNQIRDAFGGYLYEISGSNINKVFGGFYASISGNYLTLFDLSKKYEMTDSLSKKQLLVVAALLFGNY